MLAQSFKTATQLKIRDDQLLALQKTLVWFETKKSRHVAAPTYSDHQAFINAECRIPQEVPAQFNLGVWIAQGHECGTIACIGGTASMLGATSFAGWYRNRGLRSLFNPSLRRSFANITVEQAASALRNYLQTGRPCWVKVLKGSY